MNITKEHTQSVDWNIYSQSPFDIIICKKDILTKILEFLPKDSWNNYFLTCKKIQKLTLIPRIYNSFFLSRLEKLMDCSDLKKPDLNCSPHEFFSNILNATADRLSSILIFNTGNLNKQQKKLSKTFKTNFNFKSSYEIYSFIQKSGLLIKVFSLFLKEAIKQNHAKKKEQETKNSECHDKEELNDVNKVKLVFDCAQNQVKNDVNEIMSVFDWAQKFEIFDSLIEFYIKQKQEFDIDTLINMIKAFLQENQSRDEIDESINKLYLCMTSLRENKLDQYMEKILLLIIDFIKESKEEDDQTCGDWGDFFDKFATNDFLLKNLKDLSSIENSEWKRYIKKWKKLELLKLEPLKMNGENYVSILERGIWQDEKKWKQIEEVFKKFINTVKKEEVLHDIYSNICQLGDDLLEKNKEFTKKIAELLPDNSEQKEYLLNEIKNAK